VTRPCHGAAARLTDLGGDRLARSAVAADDNDVGAAARERGHHRAAEARGAAGHDDDARRQVEQRADLALRIVSGLQQGSSGQ
jgi:hypothetical protein